MHHIHASHNVVCRFLPRPGNDLDLPSADRRLLLDRRCSKYLIDFNSFTYRPNSARQHTWGVFLALSHAPTTRGGCPAFTNFWGPPACTCAHDKKLPTFAFLHGDQTVAKRKLFTG